MKNCFKDWSQSYGCTALTSLYCITDLTIHQMAAQGELVYLKQELQEGEYSITGLQIRVRIGKLVSLFLIQNICCEYSKELS